MKNFKKQFMELTLAFAVINSVTLVKAFAQEIDYDDMNRQNAEKLSSQGKSRSGLMKFWFNDGLGNISLPKNRKLTAIEKDQKKLVECALKFIDKRKGLYQGPEILQSILVKAMDSEKLTADSYVLNETTNECRDAYDNLTKFKKKETTKSNLDTVLKELSRSTPAETKVAKFLTMQYLRNEAFTCINHEVSASAALGLGASAGASLLKCMNPAGEVRNYIGPKIGIIAGVSAKVDYSKKKEGSVFVTGVIAGSAYTESLDGDANNGNLVFIFGANSYMEDYYWREGQAAGLGINMMEVQAALNLRIFNSSRNWSYVIDQLNK